MDSISAVFFVLFRVASRAENDGVQTFETMCLFGSAAVKPESGGVSKENSLLLLQACD